MTCSLFDVSCHINSFLAGLWWLPWVIYGFVGVLILVALAKVKELSGWPGVFAVLTLGAYGLGYWRGRSGKSPDPIEHLPDGHPDAVPPIGTRRPAAAPQGETAWDKMVRGEQIK